MYPTPPAPFAMLKAVVIVDTKNDIGGDGVVPHREAIGDSRRVMVPDDTDQCRWGSHGLCCENLS